MGRAHKQDGRRSFGMENQHVVGAQGCQERGGRTQKVKTSEQAVRLMKNNNNKKKKKRRGFCSS